MCYCGKKNTEQMTLCGHCDEWFHHKCIGLNQRSAAALDNFECGWCINKPDEDGNCVWGLPLVQTKKGVDRPVPVRNIDRTPRACGIDPLIDEKLESWERIQAHCADEGKKINLEMAKKRKQAAELVKDAGHHVGDEMSLGGLAVRAADDRLVDDFVGEGLIEFEDE